MAAYRVAILGDKASFHHIAALSFFEGENYEIKTCKTFIELCDKLNFGDSDIALMAIENTIAGSIMTNYDLLHKYNFNIIGEEYIHIKHQLLALEGQVLGDIREVYSHPMALKQCSKFLAKNDKIKQIERFSTAGCASMIKNRKLKGAAAIASELAAEVYGLSIIEENIEDYSNNLTRFLILSKEKQNTLEASDKATLNFEIDHKPGCLVDALSVFKEYQIDMSKIQSIHQPGKSFKYKFLVDIEWQDQDSVKEALEKLQEKTNNIRVIGYYKRKEYGRA